MAALGLCSSLRIGPKHGTASPSFDTRLRHQGSKIRLCRHSSFMGRTHEFLMQRSRPSCTQPRRLDHLPGLAVRSEQPAEEPQDQPSTGGQKAAAAKARTRVEGKAANARKKLTNFLEQKSGYSWLLGPLISTTALLLPVDLAGTLERNFLAGLFALCGLDTLFVLSTDLFLVLTNKLGHHNRVAGEPQPWIGPWEFTGYPQGFPTLLNWVAYASVGVAALSALVAVFTGKLTAALAVWGPYLALMFVQVAYERLMTSERSPVTPLVPIVYTVYRLRQLARGLALLPALHGGPVMARALGVSGGLWAFYLAMFLTQLPWLFSTWNSNRTS